MTSSFEPNPGARSDWSNYYEHGAELATFFASLHHHEPLITDILQRNPSSALEAGCGSGSMASFLTLAGVPTIAVDNDPEVLKIARQSAQRWPTQPEFVEHDIFALETLGREVDVVFSQGVLEHFPDSAIRRHVEQSLSIAPRLVFSVPSKHYGVKDFGNERLMLAEDWISVLDGLGKVDVKPYFFSRHRYTMFRRKPLMLLATVER